MAFSNEVRYVNAIENLNYFRCIYRYDCVNLSLLYARSTFLKFNKIHRRMSSFYLQSPSFIEQHLVCGNDLNT